MEQRPPRGLGSSRPAPPPRSPTLRTPRRPGEASPALPKFQPQSFPTVPEESAGCRPRSTHQHQQGGRHSRRRKPAPWVLGPALTSSMRTDAESGKPGSRNYNAQRTPGAALPLLQSEREEGRSGEGKWKESGCSAHVCGCASALRGKMAERGYSFSLTTFRYGRDTQALRVVEVAGAPPPRVLFSGLDSGSVLPGGPGGNRDGNATLQSHLLGPPAA